MYDMVQERYARTLFESKKVKKVSFYETVIVLLNFSCMSITLQSAVVCNISFRFKLGVWSPCSEPCGGGQQHRNLTCVQVVSQDVTKVLPESECTHLSRPVSSQNCNNVDCMAKWIVGDWTQVRLIHLGEEEDKLSEKVGKDWSARAVAEFPRIRDRNRKLVARPDFKPAAGVT